MKQEFTISRERILQLFEHDLPWQVIRDNFKIWYPEAFQEDIQVGMWRKLESGTIFNILSEKEVTYIVCSIDHTGQWDQNVEVFKNSCFIKESLIATKEEIQEPLIKEAKKRYEKGDMCCFGEQKDKRKLVSNDFKLREDVERGFYIVALGGLDEFDDIVYKNGKWAEVIKEPEEETLEDAINNFKKTIEDLRDESRNVLYDRLVSLVELLKPE